MDENNRYWKTQERNWYNFWSAIGTAGAWYIMHGSDCEPMSFIENLEDLDTGVCWINALSSSGLSMFYQATSYQCGWNRWDANTYK